MKMTRAKAYEILMKGGCTAMFMGLMHLIGVAIYATTGWAVDPIQWYSSIGVTVVAGLTMFVAGAITTGICYIIEPEDESV